MEPARLYLNAKSIPVKQETFFRKNSSYPPFVQAKLTINQPNDPYEQEADAMADRVMRMTDHQSMSHPFFRPNVSSLQRMCTDCEEKEKMMQRKEVNGKETAANHELESYVTRLNSGGHPLSNEARNFYEPRFGYDFSQVKVHTDTVAAKSAQSINALAYTSGNHIVFNQGQYSPKTENGKKLLAHELVHTVQQGRKANNFVQRAVKDQECSVHAFDNSNPKDDAVIPKTSWFDSVFGDEDKSVFGVSSVDDMVAKTNNYINSKDNNCMCVSRLEINGHGTDGYQSVGNGNLYVNDNKALVHDSKQENIDKLKQVKFCSKGMLLLMGCHVGKGLGTTLLKRVSNVLPGVVVGGAQHYTFGKGKGGKKIVGEGDALDSKGNVKDPAKGQSFLTSPYVTWHLTVNGKEYLIEGKDRTSADAQAKIKIADKINIKTPEGETINVK
jgi:hypothetical protein